MTQTDNSDDNPSQSLPAELWFDSSAGQATSRSAEQPNGGTEQSESQDQAEKPAVPNVWVIRAGRQGESAESFIKEGVAAVGFGNLPDLSQVSGRDEIAALIREDDPQANEGSVRNRAGQLLTLSSKVGRGDLVAMPLAVGSQFALGVVTEPYHYRHDADLRHTISVNWKRTNITPLLDLRKVLPRRGTISQVIDNADRLRQLMMTGEDPGPPPDHLQPGVSLKPSVGLAGVASSLLVDVQFLEDIVALLADKGQVIFYGPPGTGKTYIAQKLAKHLASDDECRSLVQFHPSTSYEDFFEGYRPVGTGAEGGIAYKLIPGPLARIAKHAVDNPDRRHVMIIDEINRANLPRVLGELLFLLEYRDESMTTLYRSDKLFWLPKNLWFIGTMNTADRSIALVDAALRRRFNFVPFFPDDGPMAGLLDRWLEREGEPEWIGRLVSAVNDELKKDLEGSHLLLGPSHFMKKYGSSPDSQKEQLRRIWAYNIEPFIEDQFFGDPDQIARFKFDAVINRHGPEAKVVPEAHNDSNDANSGNET